MIQKIPNAESMSQFTKINVTIITPDQAQTRKEYFIISILSQFSKIPKITSRTNL